MQRGGCFFNALSQLNVKREGVRGCRAMVDELVDNFQLVVRNCDGGKTLELHCTSLPMTCIIMRLVVRLKSRQVSLKHIIGFSMAASRRVARKRICTQSMARGLG